MQDSEPSLDHVTASTRYCLRLGTFGECPEVPISESEYSKIEAAIDHLNAGMDIEIIYEMVISSYIDFEKEASQRVIVRKVRDIIDERQVLNDAVTFNKSILGVLSTTIAYLNQLLPLVRYISDQDEGTVKEVFDKIRRDQHADSLEFRFMYALRNYSQHKGRPIHVFRYPIDNKYHDSDGQGLIYGLDLVFKKEYLRGREEFKKVYDEIPHEVDLRTYMRGYIFCMSSIHSKIRDFIQVELDAARSVIEEQWRRYIKIYGEKPPHLVAVKIPTDGKKEKRWLRLNWDDLRIEVAERNRELIHIKDSQSLI